MLCNIAKIIKIQNHIGILADDAYICTRQKTARKGGIHGTGGEIAQMVRAHDS